MRADVRIVGNGIVGMSVAAGLAAADPALRIAIVGPRQRPLAASTAAGAMLNCFAELAPGRLDDPRERLRFEAALASARAWPEFLAAHDLPAFALRTGTAVIGHSHPGPDPWLCAIEAGLRAHGEPWQAIDPGDLPGYAPMRGQRAHQALFIPREGWLLARFVLDRLEENLQSRGVEILDNTVTHIERGRAGLTLVCSSGERLACGLAVVANGALASGLLAASAPAIQGAKPVRIGHALGCTIVLETSGANPNMVIRTPHRGDGLDIYHVPQQGNQYMVGATEHRSGELPNADCSGDAGWLAEQAARTINGAHRGGRLVRVNIGSRPLAADGFPALGWVAENIYLASGTWREGFHLGPYLARACSEHILRGIMAPLLHYSDPLRSANGA